jgi:hypothetical protein
VVRPWRYDYEGMVVMYLVKEQLFGRIRGVGQWKIPIVKPTLSYVPVTKSRKELYDEINRIRKEEGRKNGSRKRVKRLSQSTHDGHLDALVENNVLIRHDRGGPKNKTLYELSSDKLVEYYCYFLSFLAKRITEKNGRYGPHAQFILSKLVQFVIRLKYH